MAFTQLVLLLVNWFMLVIIMLFTVKAINLVTPFVEDVLVAKVMWYLYLAFGYSLIAVTVFTSWVIWFVGGIWAIAVLFMTWFILAIIYAGHKKLDEETLRKNFNLP